jgi:hypothetical protein
MKTKHALAVLTLSLALVGCQAMRFATPVIPVAIEQAAIAAIHNNPDARPYIGLVASVFSEFSKADKPPSAEALEAALTSLPNGGLSAGEARLVWAGSMLAYSAILTSQSSTQVMTYLDLVSLALKSAVDKTAGPASSGSEAAWQPVPRAGPTDVSPVSDAIRQYLRSR